jgi:hypothetical protein
MLSLPGSGNSLASRYDDAGFDSSSVFVNSADILFLYFITAAVMVLIILLKILFSFSPWF